MATKRLVKIELDAAVMQRCPPTIANERAVAVIDLLEDNIFSPTIDHDGPYHLFLAIEENRLVFDIRDTADAPIYKFILSLTPLRRVVRDYFAVCENYYEAIRTAAPSQIEAIDMGRRGLHNEGAEILRDRLHGKADIDLGTARRLFTLICSLHIRG